MSKRDHGQHVGNDGLEYEVPFVHQNHVNLCGDASAQMLVMFNGRTATIGMKSNVGHHNSFRLKRNPRGVFEGANDDDLVAMIQKSGLQAWNICPKAGLWTAKLVRSALETYGPYAQSVRFAVGNHWVVVTGTDGHRVIYHDPWRGKNQSKAIGDWVIAAGDDPDSAVAATEQGYVAAPDGIQADVRD
jgi:hypothetical protein